MSTYHIFSAGRQRVVGGLTWVDIGSLDDDARRKEAKRVARESLARFGVVLEPGLTRIGGRSLVGTLRNLASGMASNAVSAAAWLAAASENRRLLFIESLGEDRFWIVAAANGHLDPRTDRILDRTAAVEQVDNILNENYGDADKYVITTFGDDSLRSPIIDRFEGHKGTFDSLVREVASEPAHRLRQLVGITPAQWLACAAALVLVVAGTVGWLLYARYQEHARFEAELAAARAAELAAVELRNLVDVRIAQAVAQATAEDTATVPPDRLVHNCLAALSAHGRRVAGWTLEVATCEPAGNALTLRYALAIGRVDGTTQTISDYARAHGVTVQLDLPGRAAFLSVPIHAPDPRQPLKPSQLPAYEEVTSRLPARYQMAARSGGSPTPSFTALEPRPINYLDPLKEHSGEQPAVSSVPADRSYRRGTLSLAGAQLWKLAALSFAYPFLTLTKLELRPRGADFEWTIEASYVASNA